MRLHRLELTAFGPFAQTVEVDFDRLNDASVFLLCGDTGAGKTTVLDGICFALYGDVPGARASARQLRSHHAAETVAPRAVLELTVSGRRFRFTRSPAWQRPKRRGTGTTTEPAHVLVEERVQDAWTLRSNRLDEAGQLVGDLLGMTLAQFSQVVLLPQGQFDTFLRSSSEDRQKVLTRLFQTGRFEQVERWFAERRLDLLREHRRHAAGVAGVVHRLSEAADVPAPEEWDTDDLTGPASSGELRDWADDLVEAARRQGETARRELASAEARREQARAALATARRLAELLDRRRRALADRAALEGDAPAAEADRARLDNARRAATVAPLAEVAADSEAALGRAAERTSAAVLDLADALDTAPEQVRSDDLDAREQETADRLAAARAFLPRAEELRQAEHAQAAALARVDELEISLARSRRLLADLPGRRVELLTELAGLREVAALAG
ncbi:MAG TPA: SMC family ATPase, partial [Motilibacteraceae bacterium]|nr:SMC family ATPase [Motilibacteraceae bacterium]